MEISFHSHLDSNTVIATKFCTWHDSCAVVACAKICCDLMASNGITARRSFHRIWIAGKKSLVKRAPGHGLSHVLQQAITWTNADLLSIKPVVNNLQWNSNWNANLFIHEKAFEKVICKMAAILSGGNELNRQTIRGLMWFVVVCPYA